MKNEPDIFIRVGWWTQVKLLASRPRRLFDNWFRKQRVRENLARRRGECRRCGAELHAGDPFGVSERVCRPCRA